MARFQILYWQDVPSLVKAFAEDGTSVSRQLDAWFQQEIDRRAMEQVDEAVAFAESSPFPDLSTATDNVTSLPTETWESE